MICCVMATQANSHKRMKTHKLRARQRQLSSNVPLQDPDVWHSQTESADTHSHKDTHTRAKLAHKHTLAHTHSHKHTHAEPLSQLHSTTLGCNDRFLGALSKSQRSGKERRMRAEEKEGGRKGKERRAESGDREVINGAFCSFAKVIVLAAVGLHRNGIRHRMGWTTDTFRYSAFSGADIPQTWIHVELRRDGYTAKEDKRKDIVFSVFFGRDGLGHRV